MAISILDAFTALEDVVKDISNISVSQKLRAANYIDDLFYQEWYGVEPNRYLTNYTFKTVASESITALPSTFKTLEGGGLYRVSTGGSDFAYVPYDGGTVIFTTGQTLTAASGGTGTVREVNGTSASGVLILSKVSGTFADNDVLTGSGGTPGAAVQNGSVELFNETENQYSVAGHGSGGSNYSRRGSNLVLSKPPAAAEIVQLRYIPQRTVFTTLALTETFIVENWQKEHLFKAFLVWWGLYDKDLTMESISDARFAAVMADFKSNLSVVGEVWNEQDFDSDF